MRWVVSSLLSSFVLYILVFLIMPRLPDKAIPAPAFYPIFAAVYFACAVFAYFAIPNKDKKSR
jgi:hypothetical protein